MSHHRSGRSALSPSVARAEVLAPYRQLAARVIAQALRDLLASPSVADRESARVFLSGSRMLDYWCELADINPSAIRSRMRASQWHGHLTSAMRRGA